MKIAIILNGISRHKNHFYKSIYPVLARDFDTEVWETKFSGHAVELARQAILQGTSVVLAAGGDGTLNQVVNGLLTGIPDKPLPGLGVIPLGSGNDFARSNSLDNSPHHIIKLLKAGQFKPTDIGEINCVDSDGKDVLRYFINVCSLGMGPQVVQRLSSSKRAWGASLTYLANIIAVFFTQKAQEVTCRTAHWKWSGFARVIAIANGKTFGHGVYIAPDAECDDGVFNSFIAGSLPTWRFLICLQLIKGKRKSKDPLIYYNTAREIELESGEECLIETEGEMAGRLPARIRMLSGRINFLR